MSAVRHGVTRKKHFARCMMSKKDITCAKMGRKKTVRDTKVTKSRFIEL